MNHVSTACGCCVYAHNDRCLGPEPCPGIFIPGNVIRTACAYNDVRGDEWLKAEPLIDDEGIFIPEKVYYRASSGCQYRLIMTREMFREAWRRYIKEDQDDQRR
ncbi:MAG: hypothetical protein IJI40_08640 [Firmicutes bacterium]|nr:hypothetical protein [Bacillota bacterium]